MARFSYNWALDREKKNQEAGGKFLSEQELRKEFTKLKTQEQYAWLNDYSNNIPKQAIKDACNAYLKFFKGETAFPKFKSKKKSPPKFYIDTAKIQFIEEKVKLEKLTTSRKKNKQKINWIRLAEKNRIPIKSNYFNPRVTFDGVHWWISVGVEIFKKETELQPKGIGIDLGIKELAICSDKEEPYENINKTQKVKKLEKKKRRLQRSIARKYEKNKKGESYCKTKNIIKAEKRLLNLYPRLTNLRQNHLHQTTTEIINRKPRFIVLEDLNVKGMMKNKHLSKAIQEQSFAEFRRQIKYKSEWNGISVIFTDRFYPSSKLCSCCGNIKKELKLNDRVYHCEVCGMTLDRDKNASINLRNYGNSIV